MSSACRDMLKEAPQGYCSMSARAPAKCFPEKFLYFRFSRSLKTIKRQLAGFEISFAVVNIIKMIFVIKLTLHEEGHSAAIFWFCLWFSSICFGEISQNHHNCPVHHLKAKKEGLHGRFSCYLQFCVFFFYLKFGLKHFFFHLFCFALGRAQIRLTVQRIFENSTEGNVTNLTRKIPIFCHQTLCNRIELRQDRYLSMRRLSNLSPFHNLSHGVFFLVTSFLGVERLWILRVQFLETLDYIT